MQQYISSLIPDNDNDTEVEPDQDQLGDQHEQEIEDTIETAVDEESGEVLLSAVALEQEISLELLLNASSSTFDLDNLPTNHVAIDTIDQLTDCSESTGWITTINNQSSCACLSIIGITIRRFLLYTMITPTCNDALFATVLFNCFWKVFFI